MKVVILHLDGMGFDYFKRSDLKFAKSLPGHISRIEVYPSFFGNEVSLFTGIHPSNHNMSDLFGYNPTKTPFKNNIYFNLIPRSFLKYLAYFYGYKTYIDINMPKSHYKKFVPVSKEQAHNLKSSFLNILKENGYKLSYLNSRKFSLKNIKREILKNDCVYAMNLTYDKILHKYGIDKKINTGINNLIKDLYEFLCNNFDDDFYLILSSDHGMINTKGIINITHINTQNLYFVDSTILRVWEFKKNFSLPDKNVQLVEDKKLVSGIFFKKYITKPGYIFYPNFFQNNKSIKGMHGYEDTDSNHDAILFIYSPKFNTLIEGKGLIIDVAPTILSLLGIKKPNFMRGKVLI